MSEFLRKYGEKLSSELTPEEIASLEQEQQVNSFKRRPQDVNADELMLDSIKDAGRAIAVPLEYVDKNITNRSRAAALAALRGENPLTAAVENKPTEMVEPVREAFKMAKPVFDKLDPKVQYSGREAGSISKDLEEPVAFAADVLNPLDPLNWSVAGGAKKLKSLNKLKKLISPEDFVTGKIAENPAKMAEVLQGMDLSNIKGVSPDMRYPRINPDAVGAQHLDEATDPLIELKKLLQKK